MKNFSTFFCAFALTCFLIAGFYGCAGTTGTTGTMTTAVLSPADTAASTLYSAGLALQQIPAIVITLYQDKVITAAQYTQIATVYNQVYGSWQLAVAALQAAEKAGQNPTTLPAYTSALTTFLTNQATINNMLMAFKVPTPAAK